MKFYITTLVIHILWIVNAMVIHRLFLSLWLLTLLWLFNYTIVIDIATTWSGVAVSVKDTGWITMIVYSGVVPPKCVLKKYSWTCLCCFRSVLHVFGKIYSYFILLWRYLVLKSRMFYIHVCPVCFLTILQSNRTLTDTRITTVVDPGFWVHGGVGGRLLWWWWWCCVLYSCMHTYLLTVFTLFKNWLANVSIPPP